MPDVIVIPDTTNGPDVIVIPDTTNGPDVIVIVQEGPVGPSGTVITFGTTPPSGGNDGDIYLQYTP
jgi:hypothetical protein